ncbi:MAG: polymerase [Solirubrobacteraceae bacterium]|jgi:DNA polymerase (family 10)|nr:polymerase [Solirubrobacteraceae bacterium]
MIAAALDELGDLYELDGAVIHRVVAYRNAAKVVRDAPVSVAELALAGRVTELAGIGATLEQKILDLIRTGTIPAAEKLRLRFPAGLLQMTALPGLGPKRARRLYEELGIASLDALADAARGERLRQVRGFGEKFEQSVLASLAAAAADHATDGAEGGPRARRVLLDRALAIGELIVGELRARCPEPGARIELAGSVRRRAESVKDLDVVVAAADPGPLLEALPALEAIDTAGRTGPGAARGVTHTGMPVEVRAVAPDQFGNLLQHLTGSKQHNAALRERAVRMGLRVSEYGVLVEATGVTERCATEAEVYALVGLDYIEPELRESRGELDGPPPRLIELGDIRGDLHCHTVASDGRKTIAEMARAAVARGYEYLAITDHSASHGFGNHVSPDDLRRQIERVREIDARMADIRLLAGSEVNILPDGSPDYDDDLLAELDWVIASVHTAFSIGSDAMTARILAAIAHPLIDAIGHPTGRMLERRPPYPVDMDAVIAAAATTGTLLEINSNPNRRDLGEVNARAAAHGGAGLLINSDAHSSAGFAVLRYGVWTARRARLGPAAVLNTLPWEELATRLKRPR